MERLCFRLRIRAGMQEEYDRRHREIWPELVEAMREGGVRNYTLFRQQSEVIGVLECHPDVQTVLARTAGTEVSVRWQRWMDAVIEPEEQTRFMEIWHLD